VEDANRIKTLYAHPPSLQVSKVNNDFIIAGSSGENGLLEVEMMANTASSPWRSWGVITPDRDVESSTVSANRDYSTRYWAAYGVNLGGKLAVILVPFLLLGLWLMFGHEPDVTVPTYLSTVPNPDRKPSLVNLVFKGAVDDLDENGFYATLLDLHGRKKISIETRPSGVRITILDRSVEDAYEQSVLEFLSKFSTVSPTPKDPVAAFDTDTLKELASKVSSGSSDVNALEAQRLLIGLTSARVTSSGGKPLNLPLREILLFLVSLAAGNFIAMYIWGIPFPISIIFGSFFGVWGYGFIGGIARTLFSLTLGSGVKTTQADEKWGWSGVLNNLFEKGKYRLVKLFAIPAVLLIASLIVWFLAPLESYLAGATLVLAIAAFAQIVYAYSQPDTLFGRWRDGYYKEKLEWDAFRNHLSDLSQMSKYSPDDLGMWGTWLVYGTALGVGDKVAQAMGSLNVKIDVAPMTTMAHTHFHPLKIARAPVTYSGGGGRGGGHGGGGGHSGGGGGHGGGGGGRR